MSRFRVTAEALRRGRAEIRGADLRHLRLVLRLGEGDRVELFDGEGRARAAEIVSVSPAVARLRVLDEAPQDRESPLFLTLSVAMAKGPKIDWVVEKATELGVSRIVPFTAERTVPRREEFGRRIERWRRIATAAAAQSGRTRCPEIADGSRFADVLASGAEYDLSILFREGTRERIDPSRHGTVRRLLVVIGPEGGFSGAEAAEAECHGFLLAGLGSRILRTETAAVTAVALCQFLWGDLGGR